VLLKWWVEQNRSRRHVWPGSSLHRHKPEEVLNQIRLTRQQPGAGGNVMWSMKVLLRNKDGLAERLRREAYGQPALAPASTWLDGEAPSNPSLSIQDGSGSRLKLSWSARYREAVWLWLLRTRVKGEWSTEVLPRRQGSYVLALRSKPEVVTLSAVDRCGNVSQAAAFEQASGGR